VQTLGRRLLESYPFVPVVGSIRIVVAIFSYDGGLYFGVTGDYDGAPDIDVLTAGIGTGMEQLLALAPPAKPARAKRASRTRAQSGKRARPQRSSATATPANGARALRASAARPSGR
jgi:hypothetical protein